MNNINLEEMDSYAKLAIKNIGNIGTANLLLNGNTAIAGHNNIGKSTITKIIFSIIKAEKTSKDLFIDFMKEYDKAISLKEKELLKFNFEDEYVLGNVIGSEEFIKTLKYRLYNKYLVKYLFSTLGEYYLRIGTTEGQINFKYKNFELNCLVSSKEPIEIKVSGDYEWYTDATLISSTEVLNFSNIINNADTVIDEKYNVTKLVSAQEKDLIEKLNKVFIDMLDDNFNPIKGLYFDKYGYAFYKENEKVVEVKVLGTGKKLFAIMDRLITNKSINKNTLVLLDEPEEGMHPEWQLDFVDYLLKSKIPFVLTTHSPYIVQSLLYFDNNLDKVNYYTVKHNDIEGYSTSNKEEEPLVIVKDLTNPILRVRGF